MSSLSGSRAEVKRIVVGLINDMGLSAAVLVVSWRGSPPLTDTA